ncbi:MAG: ABC transporter substrate-binding protein, partial [Halobacteriaceae archaeon]
MAPLPKELLQPYVKNKNVKGLDQDQDVLSGEVSGNLGAFNMKEWNRSSKQTFERNPDYYLRDHASEQNVQNWVEFKSDEIRFSADKVPYLDKYTYQIFDEPSTSRSAGQVHSAGIPNSKIGVWKNVDNVDIFHYPYDTGIFWLNINHRINGWEPLRYGDHNHNSRKVRQAWGEIHYWKTIKQEIKNNLANPTHTYHFNWGPFYPPEEELYIPTGEMSKAKTMLEEGTSNDYGYNSNGQFVDANGEQVELTAVLTTSATESKLEAQYWNSRAQEAGFKTNVVGTTWVNLLVNYAQNSAKNVEGDTPWSSGAYNGGPYDAAVSNKQWDFMIGLGFGQSPYTPWSSISSTMVEKGTFNLWGYHQDRFDIKSVVNQVGTMTDRQKVQQKLTDLFAFLSKDMPM